MRFLKKSLSVSFEVKGKETKTRRNHSKERETTHTLTYRHTQHTQTHIHIHTQHNINTKHRNQHFLNTKIVSDPLLFIMGCQNNSNERRKRSTKTSSPSIFRQQPTFTRRDGSHNVLSTAQTKKIKIGGPDQKELIRLEFFYYFSVSWVRNSMPWVSIRFFNGWWLKIHFFKWSFIIFQFFKFFFHFFYQYWIQHKMLCWKQNTLAKRENWCSSHFYNSIQIVFYFKLKKCARGEHSSIQTKIKRWKQRTDRKSVV